MKAFKEFWKDCNKWLVKHWKGYTVLCIVAFFTPYIIAMGVNHYKRKNENKDFFETVHEVLNDEES